jgi:phenylacetate 2-hydroxylase
MCTAVNFSNRVLYALYLRLILSFRFSESKSNPAETHYISYKDDPSASNAIASSFKVRLTPRDDGSLEGCLAEAERRLSGFYTGKNAESLIG